MWWLVYLGFIIAMLAPMAGVVLGIRCYKAREIGSGKGCVIGGVGLSIAFAIVGVYLVTVLLATSGIVSGLVWFALLGPFIVLDLVYLRMMLFTRWAKRLMGKCQPEPEEPPRRIMSIDDIGKDWEKRIAEMKKSEEE